MKNGIILKKMVAVVMVLFIAYGCNSFAQNSKSSKDKKKSHTEYVHLKIEKDDDGKVTKIDTLFSSTEIEDGKHIKAFSINIPDIDEEIEKSIEKEFDENIDPLDFFKHFHMSANDSFVDINIMNKIKIECNGKEGHESVKIFGSDDDSWVEKIYNKTVPGKTSNGKNKTFVININDEGVKINGDDDDDDKSNHKKKCKIIMSKVYIDDATKDEKKKIDGKDAGKFKELDVDDLTFSPNPGNGKFKMGFELDKKGDVEIKIVDMNGKELYKENLKNFKGEYEKEIDISKNGKGVYLLNIRQDNRQICKKIVIQ